MSKSNARAAASLVLSLSSLIGYSRVVEQSAGIVFVGGTGFVFVVGIISLTMGLFSRRQEPPPNPVLATISIVVALGYLGAVGIVMLNIVVDWMIR